MKSTDFRAWIKSLSDKAGNSKYDYRVTVQRLTDGLTKTERVSGGWNIAEAYCDKLAHSLGLSSTLTL